MAMLNVAALIELLNESVAETPRRGVSTRMDYFMKYPLRNTSGAL